MKRFPKQKPSGNITCKFDAHSFIVGFYQRRSRHFAICDIDLQIIQDLSCISRKISGLNGKTFFLGFAWFDEICYDRGYILALCVQQSSSDNDPRGEESAIVKEIIIFICSMSGGFDGQLTVCPGIRVAFLSTN